jgi:hypothetical protein
MGDIHGTREELVSMILRYRAEINQLRGQIRNYTFKIRALEAEVTALAEPLARVLYECQRSQMDNRHALAPSASQEKER